MRRAPRRRRRADIVRHERGRGFQRATGNICPQTRLDPVQDRAQHRDGREWRVDVDVDGEVGGVGGCGGEREFRGGLGVFFSKLGSFLALLCSVFVVSGFCLSGLPARPMYWPGLISSCGPIFSPRTLEGSSVSDRARLMDMLYV